jgi:pyruvate formate lyase activating enzyme
MEVCSVGAHQNKNGAHTLNHSLCNNCGSCAEVCVFGAVKMTGKEMSVDEVLDIVVRDMKYYEKSGGGMTLSGGDPLFQHSFSLALLKKAKELDIKTCIETAGFVNQEIMEKIVPYTDLILHDYKISDAAMHAEFTGVDNRKILDNIDFLGGKSVPVVLRCPVIPGINDNMGHFAAIAGLSKKYNNILGVEIMPYHEFGKEKYEQTGRIYGINSKMPSRDVSDNWIEQLRSMGCRNVKKG